MRRNFCFKLFFLVFSFFLCITCANAKECTTKEFRELKNLAKKIEFSYEFEDSVENLDNSYFVLTGYNLNNKFYLVLDDTKTIEITSSKEILNFNFPRSKTNINVYASNKTNCEDELLNTVKIEFPAYNKYYTREECEDKKNLNVCKKWYNTSKISEEDFKKAITVNKIDEEKQTVLQSILYFVKKYGLYALGVIIIISIPVIIMYIVRKRKSIKI